MFIKKPEGCEFEASWFIPKPSVLVLNEFHEKVHSWMAYQGVLCLSMYPKDVISTILESISKPSASSRGENIPSGGLVSLIGLRDVLGGFLGKRPAQVREAKSGFGYRGSTCLGGLSGKTVAKGLGLEGGSRGRARGLQTDFPTPFPDP